MATSKPQLKTYVSNEVYEKFKKIAESENRSISNYLEFLVMREINSKDTETDTSNNKKT